MRADVIRRISEAWSRYQEFKGQEIAGESLEDIIRSTDNKEEKFSVVEGVCGEPPFKDMNCAFLAWEVDRDRM